MYRIDGWYKVYNWAREHFGQDVLFFKIGDFYECLEEDAEIVAENCNLTLTEKSLNHKRVRAVGFPAETIGDILSKIDNKLKFGVSSRLISEHDQIEIAQGIEEDEALNRRMCDNKNKEKLKRLKELCVKIWDILDEDEKEINSFALYDYIESVASIMDLDFDELPEDSAEEVCDYLEKYIEAVEC